MNGGPDAPDRWGHRRGWIDLTRPVVMGILNTTPDSFSDGGEHLDADRALDRAERMVAEGADLIDIGGESTRPGAAPVEPDDELARVVPVLRLLRKRLEVPLSIDTRRTAVARVALDEGADIVNDVSALGDPAMPALVASSGAGVVLMHMRGRPATMQVDPRYDDVVAEVGAALAGRARYARESGIAADRIVLDPGIGFGKTHLHNVRLIASLDRLLELGYPIMLGISRKAFLGELLGGAPVGERAVATAAGCVIGLVQGARLFRVHDVGVVRQALEVAHALRPTALAH
jgi:dihydropteroate synthase